MTHHTSDDAMKLILEVHSCKKNKKVLKNYASAKFVISLITLSQNQTYFLTHDYINVHIHVQFLQE